MSDHWLPISPVTGRLDAFEWKDPLAGEEHAGAVIDAALHDVSTCVHALSERDALGVRVAEVLRLAAALVLADEAVLVLRRRLGARLVQLGERRVDGSIADVARLALGAGAGIRNYYPADYNAIIDPPTANGGRSRPYLFPALTGGAPAWQVFPSFRPTDYGNGVPVETTTTGTAAGVPNHASIYNSQRPQGTNRQFDYTNLLSLLRPSVRAGAMRPLRS